MKILKNNYLLIILFGLSLIAILPFFHSGFFSFHDDTQVQRVFEMKVALLDGSFPARWVKDLGYGLGYPIFNFYAPLPYYIGAFLSILGLDLLLATKLMIVIGVIGSAFSMYFLAKEFWGKIGGFFSALLYVFAPYHALNIYVRGDIGEVYSFLFAPLIFFSLWKYHEKTNYLYLVLGALSYCGLVISHNLSAMMLTPFIFIICILLFVKKRNFMIFAIPIIGIFLSAFYAIPALLEMRYTNVLSIIGGKADFRDHFICPIQLWSSPWMYGGSASGCIDGMSLKLGKLHLIFGFIPILFAAFYYKKDKFKSMVVFLVSLFLLISIFLSLEWSKFVWETISFMEFFQYPWRFLLVATLFSSFLGGAVIYYIFKIKSVKDNKLYFIPLLIILILPLILYSKLFVPQTYFSRSAEYYTNESYLIWETSKISDEYMPAYFNKPKNPSEIIKNKITGENVRVKELTQKTNRLSATVLADSDTKIIIHIPYFPTWKFYVNGKLTDFEITDSGVLLVIPKGKNKIEARFEQTRIENLANLISLSGVLALFAGIIYYKQKNKNE
jgi:uncharacterized membrane protein